MERTVEFQDTELNTGIVAADLFSIKDIHVRFRRHIGKVTEISSNDNVFIKDELTGQETFFNSQWIKLAVSVGDRVEIFSAGPPNGTETVAVFVRNKSTGSEAERCEYARPNRFAYEHLIIEQRQWRERAVLAVVLFAIAAIPALLLLTFATIFGVIFSLIACLFTFKLFSKGMKFKEAINVCLPTIINYAKNINVIESEQSSSNSKEENELLAAASNLIESSDDSPTRDELLNKLEKILSSEQPDTNEVKKIVAALKVEEGVTT